MYSYTLWLETVGRCQCARGVYWLQTLLIPRSVCVQPMRTLSMKKVGVSTPPTRSSPSCSTLLFKLRSQSRFSAEELFDVIHETCRRNADSYSVALIKSVQLHVVVFFNLECHFWKTAKFLSILFFLFCFLLKSVAWGCWRRDSEVSRANQRESWRRGRFFFQCWVLLKHDCCHVQSVDILHVPWQKGEVTLMLPFVLLAGYLWRGSSVCFHAAVGVSCGGQGSTVSAGFIDLDSRRRHT